jgi:hypothetical protein
VLFEAEQLNGVIAGHTCNLQGVWVEPINEVQGCRVAVGQDGGGSVEAFHMRYDWHARQKEWEDCKELQWTMFVGVA